MGERVLARLLFARGEASLLVARPIPHAEWVCEYERCADATARRQCACLLRAAPKARVAMSPSSETSDCCSGTGRRAGSGSWACGLDLGGVTATARKAPKWVR